MLLVCITSPITRGGAWRGGVGLRLGSRRFGALLILLLEGRSAGTGHGALLKALIHRAPEMAPEILVDFFELALRA